MSKRVAYSLIFFLLSGMLYVLIFNGYHEPTREMINEQLELMIRTINVEPIEVSCVYEKSSLWQTYLFKLDKKEMKEFIKIASSDNLELEGDQITGQFMKKIFFGIKTPKTNYCFKVMYQTYNPDINSKSCYIVLLREPFFNLEELYYAQKKGNNDSIRNTIATYKSFNNSRYMFCNYQLGIFIDKIINKYIVNNTNTEFYHSK